jgi:alkylated DNA nucleotide flippase Atl1
MAPRKTWHEKLEDSKDLPKVIKVKGSAARKRGYSTLALPAPREVDALMKAVPRGKLITINELRAKIARRHGAPTACPIVTGIFAWIAAHAAQEALDAGETSVTPYWRTLKANGEINPKYPGGAARSADLLRSEGHSITCKRERYYVVDYERALVRASKAAAPGAQRSARPHLRGGKKTSVRKRQSAVPAKGGS